MWKRSLDWACWVKSEICRVLCPVRPIGRAWWICLQRVSVAFLGKDFTAHQLSFLQVQVTRKSSYSESVLSKMKSRILYSTDLWSTGPDNGEWRETERNKMFAFPFWVLLGWAIWWAIYFYWLGFWNGNGESRSQKKVKWLGLEGQLDRCRN